jgi:hypothetical protein
MLLDHVGPKPGGYSAPLRERRAGAHAPFGHSCIILQICKQCVRTKLTEGYQAKRPSETSPGAVLWSMGTYLGTLGLPTI